jgi:hypothetical protein
MRGIEPNGSLASTEIGILYEAISIDLTRRSRGDDSKPPNLMEAKAF